jgi:hypothetical protein
MQKHVYPNYWLEEKEDTVRFAMFRMGKRIPTIHRGKEQYLEPLKSRMLNKALEWRWLKFSVSKSNFCTLHFEKKYWPKGLQIYLYALKFIAARNHNSSEQQKYTPV